MALPVSDLKEIAEGLEIIRGPSEGFVAGSVALRGSVYPLIDIKKRLGIGVQGLDGSTTFLLVNTPGGTCAFAVDGVVGVSGQAEGLYSVPVFAFKEPDVISSFMMQGEDIVSVLNSDAVMRDIF